MKKPLVVVAMLVAIAATVPTSVQARDGGAIAAGVLGGLAAGAIIGGAAAQPRRYYAPEYEPAPVYVVPEQRRTCIEQQEVWSHRYQHYVIRNVRVPCY